MGFKLQSRLPRPVYVNHALRSPIGRFGGSLSQLSAPKLAALNIKALSVKSEQEPDFVLMGHARQAGAGPNPARQATIFSGLKHQTPAYTLNHACASGLTAIIHAAEKIALNHADCIFAGGVESMSNTPYFVNQARWGQKMGPMSLSDGMYQDGFYCPMAQLLMGATVEEKLVPQFKISRQEQDEWALHSQLRAAESQKLDLFSNEIFHVDCPDSNAQLDHDEHVRAQSSLESLKKLPAVFKSDGTLTAGNSSGVTDGSAFLELNSSINNSTLAELIDWEFTALEPELMGLGPVDATLKLLSRHNLKIEDIQIFELNEAFAAQLIACQRTLKIHRDKLNPRGGAIALGHPIGATGARISVSLIHQLKALGSEALGVATLCVSGGQGISALYRSL